MPCDCSRLRFAVRIIHSATVFILYFTMGFFLNEECHVNLTLVLCGCGVFNCQDRQRLPLMVFFLNEECHVNLILVLCGCGVFNCQDRRRVPLSRHIVTICV